MPITPDVLRNTRFRVVFRGYEIDAVDRLLDELEAQLRTASRLAEPDSSEPADDLATAERTTSRVAEEPDSAARALRTISLAQQMADQLVAAAGADADQIIAAARDAAAQTLATARHDADRLLTETQELCRGLESEHDRRQREQTESLEARQLDLQSEIDRLALIEQQHRASLDQLVRDLKAAVAAPAVTVDGPA